MYPTGDKRTMEQCGVDLGSRHRWLRGNDQGQAIALDPSRGDTGRGPTRLRQGKLFGIEYKGDFAGLGVFDAIEGMDTHIAIPDNLTADQCRQLPYTKLPYTIYLGHAFLFSPSICLHEKIWSVRRGAWHAPAKTLALCKQARDMHCMLVQSFDRSNHSRPENGREYCTSTQS